MQSVDSSFGTMSRRLRVSPAGLPFIIGPSSDRNPANANAEISDLHAEIRRALLTSGAVVLRGFAIEDISRFKEISENFAGSRLWSYAGGASPRSILTNGVYTSTDYPPEMPLSLHNGLSYSTDYPRRIFFFCAIEPVGGGETTLGDGRRILAEIGSEITDLFKSKGILYVRNLASDKASPYSWESAFETDDREVVESICRHQRADFEWTPDGGLRVSFVGPATVIHPKRGRKPGSIKQRDFMPATCRNSLQRATGRDSKHTSAMAPVSRRMH
jgi:alpha-ketoglutarate-dependent taurine dioxygenase